MASLLKLRYFMKPAKKSLVYLGGKMRFEFWPLWQCWAVWPIQILFSRQGRLKIFLAGFIKYLNFKISKFLPDYFCKQTGSKSRSKLNNEQWNWLKFGTKCAVFHSDNSPKNNFISYLVPKIYL